MTAETTALGLLADGFWPTVIDPGEKKPTYRRWGLDRLTEQHIRQKYRSSPQASVGLCLGPGRGPDGSWIIDLEGDGPGWQEALDKLLGGEQVETMGWSSTRGSHSIFVVDGDRLEPLLATLQAGRLAGTYHIEDLPGLEIRTGGHKPDGTVKQVQSVCPPSPGTDGTPRQWISTNPPAPLPDAAYTFLEAISKKTNGTAREGIWVRDTGSSDPPQRLWFLAKLEGLSKNVATAQEGTRHNTLRAVAVTLGGYLHFGYLMESEVISELQEARRRCGLPDTEDQTIVGGIAYGKEHPCDWPDGPDRPGDPGTNGKAHQGSDRANKAEAHASQPDSHAQAAPGTEEETDDRKSVTIETGKRYETLEAVLSVLPEADNLYRRGNILVTVETETREEVKITKDVVTRHVSGSPKVVPLSIAGLGCLLTRIIEFGRWETIKGEFVSKRIDPPQWLIEAVRTNGVYPGVRALRSLAECPYPQPDGTIRTENGYDPNTSTYLQSHCELPPGPEKPDQNDAEAAAKRLIDLVGDFPFKADSDRAVWLAGLLTVVSRPAISGPVPGIAVIANMAGVGKGMLIDIIGLIASGRRAPATGYPKDAAEAGKTKTALALSGASIVLFDNLEAGQLYGSGPLDSALTCETVNDRILGESRTTGEIDLRPSWFLTGNNVRPGKDAFRRWLPCNLETSLEHPEEREDIKVRNIREHVLEHRGELLRDVLTILRGHGLAGRPPAAKARLGSFEDWDDIVRGAVMWSYGKDPCETRREAADESPERLQRLALLEAWKMLPESEDGWTCNEVIKECGEVIRAWEAPKTTTHVSDPDPTGVWKVVIDAVRGVSRNGDLPSSLALGKTIAAMKGVNIDGKRFESAGKKHQAQAWKVVQLPQAEKTQAEAPKADTAIPF